MWIGVLWIGPAGRHVDRPCGRQISPWPAGKVTDLAGLRTQTQNAAFFERKGPKRKPWPRGKSLNRKK